MSIDNIVHWVLDSGGKVFGGFLRDMIAGEAPTDLDVLFSNEDKFSSFLRKMIAAGFFVRSEDSSSQRSNEFIYEEYPMDATHYRVFFQSLDCKKGDKIEKIDIVIPYGPGYIPEEEVNILDVDVNQLVLTNTGLRCRQDMSVFGIISNIKNREMEVLPGCRSARLKKMKEKGYKVKSVSPTRAHQRRRRRKFQAEEDEGKGI